MSHSPDSLKRIPYRFLKNEIRRVSSAPGSSSTTSLPSLYIPRDEQGATTPQSPTTLPPRHAHSGTVESRQVARPGRTSSRLQDAMPSETDEHANSLRKESQQKNGSQAAEEASTKDLHTVCRASHRAPSRERLCSATKSRTSSISETCQVPSTKELHPGRRASHKKHSRERVSSTTMSRASCRQRSQERLNSATKQQNSSGSLSTMAHASGRTNCTEPSACGVQDSRGGIIAQAPSSASTKAKRSNSTVSSSVSWRPNVAKHKTGTCAHHQQIHCPLLSQPTQLGRVSPQGSPSRHQLLHRSSPSSQIPSLAC